uniref:Putative complement factor bb n=1 Tax=Ixodes ricinus TaxID=34613 RepID=A0A6B0VGR4_IXORI
MAVWWPLYRVVPFFLILWVAGEAYHIRDFGSNAETRKTPSLSKYHPDSWYHPQDAPSEFEDETTDDGDEEDVREGCPQNREEAAALGRRCLRKCKTDEDCISTKKKCLCDGLCGWSCVRPDLNCDELQPLENGQFRVSGDYFGARVYYECDDNFWMSGPKERMCQGDGRWSSRAPECKKQPSCNTPPSVPHSRTNASDGARDFVINSTVRYNCFPGYDAKGFDVAKCIFYNSSAQWFGPDLKCEPKSCGPPGEVEHGRRMGTMTRFTSSVKYECHEGYELFGRAHRYCQSSGQWSGTLPECRPVQCDKPDDPLNGRAIYTELLFNSLVKYECRHGYRIKGPPTARCNSQRQWEGAPTHCVEIDCGHPGHLHNGYVEFGVSTLNAKASYNCFDGMKFQGQANSSVCLDTGNWSNPLPKCLAPCKIPALEHAFVNLSTPESRLEHGRLLNVSCQEHYELAYNATPPKCNNGSWTHLPICAPARCKSLPERPAHGIVIAPKTEHGMRALFHCVDGYELVGPNVTVCQFGNWTHKTVPVCREITCSLPPVEHGSFRELTTERPLEPDESVGHGTLVELFCNPGYQVQGQPELRCWQGGWGPAAFPECLPEPCELPTLGQGHYLGGYRAGLTISPGSSVEYDCDEETVRLTPPLLRCQEGRLRPDAPGCSSEAEGTPAFDRVPGEYPDTQKKEDQMALAATTSAATPLPHPTTTWPSPRFSGGDVAVPPSRAASASLSNRACSAPERLHNALAYQSPSPDEGGDVQGVLRFPHGTEVVFRCIDGAGGERSTWKLLCEDGSWLGRPEKCEEVDPRLSVPREERRNRSCVFRHAEPNLEAFLGDRRVTEDAVHLPPGTELVFRCKDIGKYSLIGSTRRRCVYGDWDGIKPSCFGLSQENDYALEKPPTILFRPHVTPVAQSNDGKLIVYPGAILHLECLWLRKYGTPKWEVSHKSRKYAEGWTTEPGRDSQLEYRLSIYHAKKDDTGRYTCVTPMGHKHSVDIVVSPVHCDPLPNVSGLLVSTTNTRMGTKVVFSCEEGKRIQGSQQATCLPSGNWSADLPYCQVAECQDISGSSDGLVMVKAEDRVVGSRAHFSCPQGYGLRGQARVECLDTGQWSGPLPSCVEVRCSGLPAPENGFIEGGPSGESREYRGGDLVRFGCRTDHMMLGAGVVVCEENDRWSAPVPKCVPACQYPSVREGARISSRVSYFYRINETVTFECPDGFQLRGSPMIQCIGRGRWSAAVPRCQPLHTARAPGL